MYDCSIDIRAYHYQEVTLPKIEQDGMRNRRSANRDRLRKGLKKSGKCAPRAFFSQGSYAMKTMVRDLNNDYDIDDGVYFRKEDLIGPRGADITSLEARKMIRDAVDNGRFKHAPVVRQNCVRVYYDAGYHVDLPVYRRVVTRAIGGEQECYELAASSGWKRSDARKVSAWYEKKRSESADGQQLRRINRNLKKFARSRHSWRAGILSGFGISALVVDCFQQNDREDLALYNTIVAIRNRLEVNLEIAHPVTPCEYITSGTYDARARSFLDRLSEAIDTLRPLFSVNCTREQALKCWDKVFHTSFFSERFEDAQRAAVKAPPIIGSGALLSATSVAAGAVDNAGGGRHA